MSNDDDDEQQYQQQLQEEDMDYDPEMQEEYDDEGDVIELGPQQLRALLLRY